MWLATCALTRALSGNYVNFGVFELYRDAALSDALSVAIRLSLTIPLDEIPTYRKVAKAYFAFLEVLCHNHLPAVAAADDATFAHVVRSLEAGLRSLDVSISSQRAAAIDVLAANTFKAAHLSGRRAGRGRGRAQLRLGRGGAGGSRRRAPRFVPRRVAHAVRHRALRGLREPVELVAADAELDSGERRRCTSRSKRRSPPRCPPSGRA